MDIQGTKIKKNNLGASSLFLHKYLFNFLKSFSSTLINFYSYVNNMLIVEKLFCEIFRGFITFKLD